MSTPSHDKPDVARRQSHLLDCLRTKLGLKNDASLCRALGVAPAVISKIRHGRLRVTAGLMIRMHFVAGLSIVEIYDYLGLEHK